MGRAARARRCVLSHAARLPLRPLGLLSREADRRGIRLGSGCRRARRHRAAAAHREARDQGDVHARRIRSAHISARRRPRSFGSTRRAAPPVRPATSRSTASDLDNWVTGSARSYAASGITAGQRIVSTYNAGPFVAGAALAAFDRIGLCHIPVGTGNTERLMLAVELLEARSGGAHAVLRRVSRRVGSGAGRRSRGVERRARARGRRARRRRAGLPREARGGLGRQGHRGDGHRRHRRVALGGVRGAGRHAPGRARLRPRRADRSRDRRAPSSWTTAPRASSC